MNSLSWERGGQSSSYHSSNGKDRASKCEQILAFGYGCKLFDDENSARFLDQGKNLVPSSGDNDLLIDRFDVRGYLNAVELEKYAAKFDFDYKSQLTSDEIELERELDKERYRDLYPAEEQSEHDEELRRLKESIEEEGKKYNQIQFDYEQLEPRQVEDVNCNSAFDGQDNDEPFALPDGLVLPDHIQLPSKMKEHNLIEKTARFINKQGAQMEILLKAKQSYNSQFDFLTYDSPLNPYYKHLVQLLKDGTYNADQEDAGQQSDESTEDEGYLHPSLCGSSRPTQPTYEGSSSYHSYSFAYQPTNPSAASNPTKTTISLYSKLAENLKDKIVVNESFYKPKIIESKGVRYDLNKSSDPTSQDGQCRQENTKEDRPEKCAKQSKNSSIQTKGQSVFELIPEIPADIKLIIEKLAQYVCKNGDEFEKTIKGRNESRFEFLNSGHKFHFYYVKTKLQLLEEKRKKEAESARRNGSSARPISATKATEQAGTSDLPSESNSTDDYASGKTVQPFVISAKKSTSFKEDLEAKQLREKQEERKRKAAEFLNKLKLQKSGEKSPEKKVVEEQPNRRIIGPQLPADRQREDLRNTPSPLREFYDDLDIRVDQQRKQHVFDEIKSIKDKLSRDEKACCSPEPEQTSFKRTAPKSKQYRVRERSSSGSERSAADSADRGRRSQSKPNYDAYRPRTARRRSRSRSKSNHRSSGHRSRHSSSRSRSPKRRKSHRSKKHKRSKERSRRRSRDRRGVKSRENSEERSRDRSRNRSRDKSKDRSRGRSPDRSRDRS